MKKVCCLWLVVFSLLGCSNNTIPDIKGKTFIKNNSNYTITFDAKENKFYGKALNNYFGTYKLEKNQLSLELTGATMMMGSPQDMENETIYFKNLSKINSYNLNNKTLTLKGTDIELIYKEKQ